MYIGAIDIETFCPDGVPPDGDFTRSEYFEPFAIGVGRYNTKTENVTSDILFRRGDESQKWTCEMIKQANEWFTTHPVDAVITYNGNHFDKPHLLSWANECGRGDKMESLFETHIDLFQTAGSEKYKFEDVCVINGIYPDSTKYSDYDFSTKIHGTTTPSVSNKHIGTFIAERYIELIESDIHSSYELFQLKSLIYDYTISDIDPLFELYEQTPESHVHKDTV